MLEDFAPFEQEKDGYILSTDGSRLDIAVIHAFFRDESYWAPNITLAQLDRALARSLVIGVYAPDGQMAAFARVVTDYAVFAYLRDVFTLPAHRGKGLATWLATAIRLHPEMQTISTWMLATRDAHSVYERAGYKLVPHPEYYMNVPKPGPTS
jgi:GNAT superfamily N-acetyltransferase